MNSGTNISKQKKYNEALRFEIFNKEEYGCVKDVIKQSSIIFDIGGHIGLFSQWCKSINPQTKIHYFEPIKESYLSAQKNLKTQKDIILNNVGIGGKSYTGELLYNSEKTMQSSKYSSFLNKNGFIQDVEFVTLKDYIQNQNIDKIDLLKMDVEGMEFEIFESRGKYEWSIIKNIIAEIHLINDDFTNKWKFFESILKKNFSSVEKIESGYTDKIFLIRCQK